MKRVCVINAVGLTEELLPFAPNLQAVGECRSWRSPIPAVTCTSQATMLTGLPPSQHGIVGNGWFFRDTGEVRFWQQSNALVQGEKLTDRYDVAKMFWWFNQGSRARLAATPKPHYGCDGSKQFGILDQTECSLEQQLGPFPFFNFWGPKAGFPASEWIGKATAIVLREQNAQLTLAYLPHLDYDLQRLHDVRPADVKQQVEELDRAAKPIIDACRQKNIEVVVVSEYGLVPVNKAVMINRVLREEKLLTVRDGPFGEMLMPLDSKAFAVVDHQVAHVYVQDSQDVSQVRSVLEQVPGIASVVAPGDIELDHERSGELIALADEDAWFAYYYWLDDQRAPDFARTVDIHRKPGYDPCELFMTSPLRAAARLLQKKMGMRYKMDVIPLDTSLVGGSHGLRPDSGKGPIIIGPSASASLPECMTGLKSYIETLLG